MAKFEITAPDGNTYQVSAPDDASHEDVLAYAKQNYNKSSAPEEAHQTPDTSEHFWETEKQQGLPVTPLERLKQVGEQFKEGAMSPMPGSLLSVPIKAMQQTAQQAGADIARKVEPSIGTIGARGVGMVSQAALDPSSYIGAGLGTPIKAEAAEAVESGMAGFKQAIKNLFTKPATQSEIEKGSENVTQALKKAKSTVETKLNAVKKELGINWDFNANVKNLGEEEKSLVELKNDYLKHMSPEQQTKMKALEKGDTVRLKSSVPGMPEIEAVHKGPMMLPPSPEYAEKMGWSKEMIDNMTQPAFDIKSGIPEHMGDVAHPANSTLGRDTLLQHGYDIPKEVPYPNAPKMEESLAGATTKDVTAKAPEMTATDAAKQKIAELFNLKKQLQEQVNKKSFGAVGDVIKPLSTGEDATIKGMIANINDKIDSLPGGKPLREAEGHYSDAISGFKSLANRMKTPGKAEDFLRRLFLGKSATTREQLATLEHLTGTKVLNELFDMFKSQEAGLTYEQLKHPLANIARVAIPAAGDAARFVANKVLPATAVATQRMGFPWAQENMSELQSVRDRLRNAE